jgi:hypothetical protein
MGEVKFLVGSKIPVWLYFLRPEFQIPVKTGFKLEFQAFFFPLE